MQNSVWWQHGVIYQIYPRSFADSNGDGFGDLNGITSRLGYLAWLGIDAIWLNPIGPFGGVDWGYDATDFRDVDAQLGTLADLDNLISKAHSRNIKIVLDLVPNHTSNRHPWFEDARSSRNSAHRDWYVWADTTGGGGRPNNWVNWMGEPAWTFDDNTGQYYLHNFLSDMPDLNWTNVEVRREFDSILAFWFDRGVDGFRIDVADFICHDPQLRDNPAACPKDDEKFQHLGQVFRNNANRPETYSIIFPKFRDIAGPDRYLVGEMTQTGADHAALFCGADKLNATTCVDFFDAEFTATALRAAVESFEAALPDDATPTYARSSHDQVRETTRWLSNEERKIRCSHLIRLTLRGTPVFYYGEEIGLADVEILPARVRDVLGYASGRSRDSARTPMVFADTSNGGFCNPNVEPWLPVGDMTRNVASQRIDPDSTLNLMRRLIRMRRDNFELHAGSPYRTLASNPDVWAYQRGETTMVAVNLSDVSHHVEVGPEYRTIANTSSDDPAFDDGCLELAPWQGIVLTISK